MITGKEVQLKPITKKYATITTEERDNESLARTPVGSVKSQQISTTRLEYNQKKRGTKLGNSKNEMFKHHVLGYKSK